jgi:hypothetical protein
MLGRCSGVACHEQLACADCPSGNNPVHLLVFHDRGEGSHALADRLDNLGCVHFLRGEHLHLHPTVLHAFFRNPIEMLPQDVTRLVDAWNQSVAWSSVPETLAE